MHCIESTAFYKSTRFNCRHAIVDSLSCRSSNIVYLITCEKCQIQYVGETSRSLAQRLTDHRSNISTQKRTSIAIHFNSENHSVNDLRAVAIEESHDDHRPSIVRK